jgi:hypothetical protein
MNANEKLQLAVVATFTKNHPIVHQRTNYFNLLQKRTPSALKLLLVLPFDALLWPTKALHGGIPFLRLTRCVVGVAKLHQVLNDLERSQSAPFALCRMLRVLLFFLFSTHGLACAFFYFTVAPGATHYASAPWRAAESTGSRYLRSMYWSLMTLTTAGHVDIVSAEATDASRDWEVAAAIVVALVATFGYFYINANFTTMMIQLNSRLMEYRAQLAGIDAYLRRNKVRRRMRLQTDRLPLGFGRPGASTPAPTPTPRRLQVSKDVCRRVRRHIARTHSVSAEKALFDNLPHSLQRDVLQDIHMRTLRRYLRWDSNRGLLSTFGRLTGV